MNYVQTLREEYNRSKVILPPPVLFIIHAILTEGDESV